MICPLKSDNVVNNNKIFLPCNNINMHTDTLYNNSLICTEANMLKFNNKNKSVFLIKQ